jgi:hypothetical protein
MNDNNIGINKFGGRIMTSGALIGVFVVVVLMLMTYYSMPLLKLKKSYYKQSIINCLIFIIRQLITQEEI